MSLPPQVQARIYHFKAQMLHLVAIRVFSVVLVCQIFGVSRNTFYKYRQLAEIGKLAVFNCEPHLHGSAKPQSVIDAVLCAKTQNPSFGKQRLANHLYHQQINISPNTVQTILRKHAPNLPPAKRTIGRCCLFEAIAPNVIWQMDICYLYTSSKDGFDRFLISIIDDHSRKIVGSALSEQQTVCEVVEVLKAAVIKYGVPHQLVCDNGSQFTCSEFRRVCAAIGLEVDYAPPYYPQYKGKIERFFSTSRGEMPRSNEPEIALILHSKWIDEYNQVRIHSKVTDEEHHAQPPQYRFDWKTSAARPLQTELNLPEIFTVKRPQTGSNTRQVNAAHLISYRKLSYHFPQLHKGDVVEVKDRKDKLVFLYQGTVIMTVAKSARQHSASTRIVKDGGIVLFHKRRFELDLPKGIHVLIIREGSDLVFYADGHVIFRDTGQERCQPGI